VPLHAESLLAVGCITFIISHSIELLFEDVVRRYRHDVGINVNRDFVAVKRRHAGLVVDYQRTTIAVIQWSDEVPNNNTFTWSGPSGVAGCTGKRADARLGSALLVPLSSDGCHAVPLNPLIWCTARKPRREKDYDLGLGKGEHMSHTYPVEP
jgi:hypothetical protein